MRWINETIAVGLRWALMTMVLVMTLVILGQVVWRYLIEAPFVWSEELALTLMCWITFLGSALLLQGREHLAIDIVVSVAAPRLRWAAELLGSALVLVFSLVLVWGAWTLVERTRDSITPGLQISVAWQYGGALVGGILLTLAAAEHLIDALRGARPHASDDR